ncbi:putative transposase/invertase (TIGR01784 family) [Runella defluvii]|uniref:Putative transposase/invertase (TIGR01784 family) n=1 Tax=Runella defluvii TaxID=370973 RepID=A0A7W6ET83_9BACT|nr:Rpn family recombination-promoting nuclease/putative transposase [Runella defluvii]MBB3841545.1 putative transposase/invertase (TIGR01784 family) [Runella defluvii]
MTFKEKYINPFTDFGFKKLFGTEPNKDLLINFLNDVILPQQKKVADLSYRKNEYIGHTEMDRKAVFDLYCISPSGERFIVEMQKAKQNYFKDRSVFYSTFPIQEQAQAGDWNYRLSAVYTVGILDFAFNEDSKSNLTKEVRHEVQLKNQKGDVFYDKLTFVYLEMPHFNKSEDELETTYDKWLFVLKHLPNLTERPQKLQERIFQRLFEAAEIAKFSHEEKEQYEESLKSYRDLKNVIDTAFDEGEAKGKEERATEIASNMLKKGLPIDLIGEITELPSDVIMRLKENLGLDE